MSEREPSSTPVAGVVLITGEPGTGKSTLAGPLVEELGLPLLQRDLIKETLFDVLGWSDVPHSRRIGAASFKLLFVLMESFMRSRIDFAVESNLSGVEGRETVARLVHQYQYSAVELRTVCAAAVAKERFAERARSNDRHPGHADHLRIGEFGNTDAQDGAPVVANSAFRQLDTGLRSPEEVLVDGLAFLRRHIT